MQQLQTDMIQTVRKHQQELPVSVVRMARDLGIDVYTANGWDKNISGYIRKKSGKRGGYEIFVNADHAETRRRFTIAHELAHAILHADRIGDGVTDDALLRSGLPNPVEFEANRLAADILMPWDLLTPMLHKTTDLGELAEAFNVSRDAMAIRIGVPQ